MKPPEIPVQVAEVFDRFPPGARKRLFELRTLIFDTANGDPEVGTLTETLKWGEPAYLTEQTRSGSTIRLGWKNATPGTVYVYFNCRTDLVGRFRVMFGEQLAFVGNRAVALRLTEPIPRDQLRVCIEAALTYHLGRAPPRREFH